MEKIVKTILAVALVASQITYYNAKNTSFGCTSIEAVSELKKVRSDEKAFQAALIGQATHRRMRYDLAGHAGRGFD